MSFTPKNSTVAAVAYVTQKLSLPFTVTANATPASKTTTNDCKNILFLTFEGLDGITGALTSGETTPTLATATDANGDTPPHGSFNAMVRINETIVKSISCKLVYRTPKATAVVSGKCLGVTTGTGTGTGTAMCFDFTTLLRLDTNSIDGIIEVEYTVQH